MQKLLWRSITRPGHVAHVSRRRLRGAAPVSVHTHDFAEVLWVERGSGVHLHNGARSQLRTGDLVFVRPADAHGFRDGDAGFTIVNVAFPASSLAHLERRYLSGPGHTLAEGSGRPTVFEVGVAERRLLAAASAELARHPDDLLGLERFLLNLTHDLAGRSPRGRLGGCPPWLQEACARLREPGNLAGGVRALATLAGRSPEHVARQLKACSGLRPIQLVTQARLDHATTQLALTERPIVDIALECGFDSLSHFYRLFRERLSETPRAYRLRSHAALQPAELPDG